MLNKKNILFKKKILITGGTGFIGYYLAKKCIKLNWEVHSISTKKPHNSRKIKGVKYLICDISKLKNLKKIISNKNYDYVVNLAGYVDHSKKNKTIKSHYLGCKNLAKIFLKKKIKRFLQIGSCIEYGKLNSPQKEIFKTKETFSYYGEAKLLSTKMLMNYYEKFKFPVSIARLYLVYGPKQDRNRIIPIIIYNSLENKKFNASSGKQLRDFTYITDIIDAMIKILKDNKSVGEIYNLGSGQPIQVKRLIKKIIKIVGKGSPLFGKIQFRKDEILKLYPDISKIKKKLNWAPKISLESGLKKTIFFYKNYV